MLGNDFIVVTCPYSIYTQYANVSDEKHINIIFRILKGSSIDSLSW